MLTLMAVNHHGIRVTGGRGSLMTRNVARLPPPSCGLSRLVTNLDPVDQKEVNRALLPCGHGRCGNSHGGRSQARLNGHYTITLCCTVLRALRPDIADAQFAGILPHHLQFLTTNVGYDPCRDDRRSDFALSGQLMDEGMAGAVSHRCA
jgi:hypothetical protein